MLKLYRRDPDGFSYWEAWDDGSGSVVVHWGQLGSTGDSRSIPLRKGESASDRIEAEAAGPISEGYAPWPEDELIRVVVQYPPSEFGSDKDVETKWDAVEGRINEALGWTGLGHCATVDFSGELTFVALAVDPDIAVSVLQDDLQEHGLANEAVIAIEQAGSYVAVWPAEAAGREII